jgi:hypothetical protein
MKVFLPVAHVGNEYTDTEEAILSSLKCFKQLFLFITLLTYLSVDCPWLILQRDYIIVYNLRPRS